MLENPVNDAAPVWHARGRRVVVVVMMFLAVVIGYSDRVNISVAAVAMKDELGWDQTTKGVLLSSFFAGYMAFMFISGWLASRYGGTRVFGIAVLWWSIFTLLTPLAAATSLPVLIGARFLMGIGEAAMFPASTEILSRWAAPAERARAMAFLMAGVSLGTVAGLLVTGWIVGRTGWPAAFYAFGSLGVLWTVAWFRAVVDDPRRDPRVTPEELAHIRSDAPRDGESATQQPAFPWREVARSREFWSLVVTHFTATWTLYMLLTWLPSYFHDARGVSVATSGFLSAAPWLSMFVGTFVANAVANAIERKTGRLAFTRKVMQGIGLMGSSSMLLLAQRADSVATAVATLCLATGLFAFVYLGYGPNFLDIAPRHAAVLVGFSNTIATIPGVVGVAIAGWLVDVTKGYTAVFLLAATLSALGTVVFAVFGGARRLVH